MEEMEVLGEELPKSAVLLVQTGEEVLVYLVKAMMEEALLKDGVEMMGAEAEVLVQLEALLLVMVVMEAQGPLLQ